MPRKERNSPKPEGLLLTTFDVMDFGSEDDPCFGKLYDLTADECQNCGDHEVCAIAFIRILSQKRLKTESEINTKDLEIDRLERDKEIRDWFKAKEGSAFSRKRILSMAHKRFHVPVEYLKTF